LWVMWRPCEEVQRWEGVEALAGSACWPLQLCHLVLSGVPRHCCDMQHSFLLPPPCCTAVQLYVAKRDNAKGIFKQYLDSQGGQLQVGCLACVKRV
jgi:hypothetical protein